MALHDPLPDEHYIRQRHDYKPRCSCGWIGIAENTKEEADEALAFHMKAHKETENA